MKLGIWAVCAVFALPCSRLRDASFSPGRRLLSDAGSQYSGDYKSPRFPRGTICSLSPSRCSRFERVRDLGTRPHNSSPRFRGSIHAAQSPTPTLPRLPIFGLALLLSRERASFALMNPAVSTTSRRQSRDRFDPIVCALFSVGRFRKNKLRSRSPSICGALAGSGARYRWKSTRVNGSIHPFDPGAFCRRGTSIRRPAHPPTGPLLPVQIDLHSLSRRCHR